MNQQPKRSHRRDQSGFGAIDYLLMGSGSCLAVFAAGKAIGAPECGQLFVFVIALGTTISHFVRWRFPLSKFLNIDSILYAVASIAAVILSPSLNTILPGEGIPPDVTTAGWLCWMLTFGSFLVWRDRTLLFQAVPTIALFGLIGCYDTYAPAPFLFFGFLLCLATLLGRSHSRDMLRLAVLSGYFNRGESRMAVSEQPEQSPELYESIKKGPWRWLAGPEWALLSGLVIVAFSLLGAPVIRQAVRPISGAISVLSPRRLRQSPGSRAVEPNGAYQVGRGPLTNQSMPPVPQLSVSFDRIRYLRTEVLKSYNGRGWSGSQAPLQDPAGANLETAVVRRMKDPQKFKITEELLTPANLVPLPAETYTVSPRIEFRTDGSGRALNFNREFTIFAAESTAQPVTSKAGLPDELVTPDLANGVIDPAVRSFAQDAAQGNNDYERARAVQAAISRRCKYYLGASAVPEGRDAADYFLNTSQQGYCDLFATAMVECARAINIPSHFVLGYLPDAKNTDKNGHTLVFDKDYHAWAELYFKDVGWVVFDATAGAAVINPGDDKSTGNWLTDSFPTLINIAIGGLAIALVIGLGISALKAKKKPVQRLRSDVERLYSRFTSRISKFTGVRRDLAETPDEYLENVKTLLGGAAPAASELNKNLVLALFGSVEFDEESVNRLKKELADFEALLKREPRPSSAKEF